MSVILVVLGSRTGREGRRTPRPVSEVSLGKECDRGYVFPSVKKTPTVDE